MNRPVTDAPAAFAVWWNDQTAKGDPMRRPHLVNEAFTGGWALRGMLSPPTGDDRPMWLAYRISTWHHYGEAARETHKRLIDADVDQWALIARVNAHFALPETIRGERNIHLVIPPFKTHSEARYCAGGGGTDYDVQLVVEKAPRLATPEWRT